MPGLRVDDFWYDLPGELIAQTPLERRDASRLLVLDRTTGDVHHTQFDRLAHWLRRDDLLVANNSRVRCARISTRKVPSGGAVELLLLRQEKDDLWVALARPARRLHVGTRLAALQLRTAEDVAVIPDLEIAGVQGDGLVLVHVPPLLVEHLDRYGQVPLPPYIGERLEDDERYQTVYGSIGGSAAAPTAGLHFTDDVINALRVEGVGWAEVTLHIGLDTFRPVTTEWVDDHHIHREWWRVPPATEVAIEATLQRGGRIIAVGTTAARTLETYAATEDASRGDGAAGMTEIFITPGYKWRMVNALLTNFHLPRSTLLMMISSFAGIDEVRAAYAEAIERRYRFFSFGDAMLIQ